MDVWLLAGKLLSKPQEERSPKEIKQILSWFRQRSQLFTDLEDDSLCDIVKNVKLLKVRKDFIIIRQGELGDCFYIILKGSVSVYAKKEEEGESYFTQHDHELQYVKNHKERTARFGTELAQFKNGRTFGEFVFMSDRKERSATIIANEPTELITVDEYLYKRCLHTHSISWQEKFTFVHSSPLFASLGNAYKSLLAESLTPIKVNFGCSVVKQGQPFSGLYLLAKGMATVTVDPNLSLKQYPELKAKESPDKDKEIEPEYKKDYTGPLTVIQRRRRRNALGYPAMESRLRSRLQSIATIGVNAVIGDIEFILDLPTYSATVVCAESMEVYELDRQSFHRIIARKNYDILTYMKEIVMAKLESRSQRSAHVPVYSWLLEYAQLKEQTKDGSKKKHLKRHSPAFYQTARGTGKVPRQAGRLSTVKRSLAEDKKKSSGQIRTQDTSTTAAVPKPLRTDEEKRPSDPKDRAKKVKKKDTQGPKNYTPEEFRELKKKMQAQGKMVIRSQDF